MTTTTTNRTVQIARVNPIVAHLGDLSLKNVKNFETSRGTGFTATIYWGRRKIGLVENTGTGGPNSYYDQASDHYNQIPVEVREATRRYFQALGDEDGVEQEDQFIEDLMQYQEDQKYLAKELKKGAKIIAGFDMRHEMGSKEYFIPIGWLAVPLADEWLLIPAARREGAGRVRILYSEAPEDKRLPDSVTL